MSEQVLFDNRDGIALITLNRPPSNALTHGVRQALDARLVQAIESSDVNAIVIAGAGQGFSSGAELTELDGQIAAPWVADLCTRIEDCPKPVVAALHGMVLGAGFELALAAHARVALRKTRFGFQDVKLGLVPCGGATQRLPRLLGARGALELLLTGEIVASEDPRLKRLVSRLVDENPVPAALELARVLAMRGQWQRTCMFEIGFSDPEGYQSVIADMRRQLGTRDTAETRIVSCVEAAQLLPFDQGLVFERSHFEDRLADPEARGLRHILVAERMAATPRRPTKQTEPVRMVALIGEDSALSEIGCILLDAGHEVRIVTAGRAAAQTLRQQIERTFQSSAARGRISETAMQTRLERLSLIDLDALGSVDLVIDAGADLPGDLPKLKDGLVWAVIRPGISPGQRANAAGATGRGIALRLSRPVLAKSIGEYALTDDTAPDVPAKLLRVFGRTGRFLIQTKQPAGQVTGRISAAINTTAMELVSFGADPYRVDQAARAAGFAVPPFERIDRDGLGNVAVQIEKFRRKRGLPMRKLPVLSALCDRGRTGLSAGRGFYLHVQGQIKQDAALEALLAGLTRDSSAADIPSVRIGAALIGAIANEAAALLDDKAVDRASEIDLLMVREFGFDRIKGGPLLQADLRGIFHLYKDMQALTQLSPVWQPHPRIQTMVKYGEGFFGRSVA